MKTRTLQAAFIISLSIASIGCQSHSVQITTGKEYLSNYTDYDASDINASDLNEEVKLIANIEPSIEFSSRIGLVKLFNGRITNLSPDEVEAWEDARHTMSSKFSEFIPVSPMIAEMVYTPRNTNSKSKIKSSEIFRKIRLGAARQHLDHVLVYEVFSETKTTKLASSVANWTIVGGYFIPSREIETTGFANALLIDVRNGYPYGTASATLSATEFSASQTYRDKSRNLADKNQVSTVIKLIPEVQKMMKKLMEKSKQA
jgi:hypothetical protein